MVGRHGHCRPGPSVDGRGALGARPPPAPSCGRCCPPRRPCSAGLYDLYGQNPEQDAPRGYVNNGGPPPAARALTAPPLHPPAPCQPLHCAPLARPTGPQASLCPPAGGFVSLEGDRSNKGRVGQQLTQVTGAWKRGDRTVTVRCWVCRAQALAGGACTPAARRRQHLHPALCGVTSTPARPHSARRLPVGPLRCLAGGGRVAAGSGAVRGPLVQGRERQIQRPHVGGASPACRQGAGTLPFVCVCRATGRRRGAALAPRSHPQLVA